MKRRPCRKTDAAFGPVCRCGGAKAKQAWTCQRCHGTIRGYGRQRRLERLAGEQTSARDREHALRAARDRADGELAALIDEQLLDDRRNRIGRGTLSLDAPMNGRPLYDQVAAK